VKTELECLDDIADQYAFSGGDGGFKNGMRASPIWRRRGRKRRSPRKRKMNGPDRASVAPACCGFRSLIDGGLS
jgi:hypothetical protein